MGYEEAALREVKEETKPFNSLYGILCIFVNNISYLYFVFQFPLWDTYTLAGLSDEEIIRTFNSLYGILLPKLRQEQHLPSFNSLYGILFANQFISNLVKHFQFPLWDTFC